MVNEEFLILILIKVTPYFTILGSISVKIGKCVLYCVIPAVQMGGGGRGGVEAE